MTSGKAKTWLVISLCFGIFFAKPLYWGVHFAYMRWWPSACDQGGLTVYTSTNRGWRIEEVLSSCSMFDDGRGRLDVYSVNNSRPQTLVEWHGAVNYYDIYSDNNA